MWGYSPGYLLCKSRSKWSLMYKEPKAGVNVRS